MAVAQSLEEVESLSEGLVCEYLKRRGLTKTLETFNMEISEDKVRCLYVERKEGVIFFTIIFFLFFFFFFFYYMAITHMLVLCSVMKMIYHLSFGWSFDSD